MPPLPALKSLDLRATPISTLAGMPDLPALESLYLRGNPIQTLAGMPGVKELAIEGTRIASLDEVPETVERLSLNSYGLESQITSLAGIERLTNLAWLDLRRTGITDLERLRGREPMPKLLVDYRALRKKLK